MLASDPRFRDYQLLQLELCAVLNLDCHWNMAQLPLDRAMWLEDGREVVAGALKKAMTQITGEGLDDRMA